MMDQREGHTSKRRRGKRRLQLKALVFVTERRSSRLWLAVLTSVFALPPERLSFAAPQGGVVVSGQANISAQGATTNINQSSNQAIINWQLFSIAPNETVNFNQPGPTSVTLNRVIGNEKSIISGALNANGQVFIVNSAGIVFTKGAQVNVGGLVASTLDISNNNFKAGKYQFSGNSTASVINRGNIQANPGGYVALLGNTVSNEGTITATLGTVAMASGSQVTLNFGGNSLVDVTTDKGTLNALVKNKGAIIADGGQVILTARAADALLSAQVNNTGVIQARTMAGLMGGQPRTGSIKLLATGGKVKVAGRLDASAPNGGNGGRIETSGAKVSVANNAVITTQAASGKKGLWLIDPTDFTIAASGGDITGATLSNELGSTSVFIDSNAGHAGTNGNVNVNDSVSWSANTTLTLNATNNINVNAPITATGATAGLVMTAGNSPTSFINIAAPITLSGSNANLAMTTSSTPQPLDPPSSTFGVPIENYVFLNSSTITLSGAHPTLTINGNGYQVINTLAQLQAISPNEGAPASLFYALGSDINAGGVTFPGPVIGALDGTLAGLNHKISNLTINDTTYSNNDALIGILGAKLDLSTGLPVETTGLAAVVRDIGLVNVNVSALSGVVNNTISGSITGGLVSISFGTINNAYVNGGSISGLTAGGLAGENFGNINNSWTNVSVTGLNDVGGLVGLNSYDTNTNLGGVVSNSYANGPVSATGGTDDFGGWIGAYAVGGLVGYNNGNVFNSHATGSVSATDATGVGGLVGVNNGLYGPPGVTIGIISNSYATGNVTQVLNNSQTINSTLFSGVGGLAGENNGGFISDSHASGNVTVAANTFVTVGSNVGGLVGNNQFGGVINNSSATGAVTGVVGTTFNLGGLVGSSDGFSTVTNSFASGQVSVGSYPSASSNTGGLIGYADPGGTYSGNSWSISGTGQSTAGGVGAGGDGIAGATGTNPPGPPGPPTTPNFNAPATQVLQGALQSANVVGTVDTAQSAASPPRPGVAASAGTGKTAALSEPSFSENVSTPTAQTEGEWLRRKQATDAANARAKAASLEAPNRSNAAEVKEAPLPRRHAFTPPPRPVVKPKGAGFGATIHSIEIEGKQYELHDKPGSKPQAPDAKTQVPESTPQTPASTPQGPATTPQAPQGAPQGPAQHN